MFGSTWVSCSPWAVQDDGSQDLGVLGSHPPVPLVRSPQPTHTVSTHSPRPGFCLPTQGRRCSRVHSTRNPVSLTAGSLVPTW